MIITLAGRAVGSKKWLRPGNLNGISVFLTPVALRRTSVLRYNPSAVEAKT